MAEEQSKMGETSSAKRKRGGLGSLADVELATRDQRVMKLKELEEEFKGLVEYYNVQQRNMQSTAENEQWDTNQEQNEPSKKKQRKPTLEGLVVLHTEGSPLPLSCLVSHIFQKLSCIPSIQATSPALVRTAVLSLGHRVSYGLPDPNADSLEDQSCNALWCWEITEFKLLPKELRPVFKARRVFRKMIHERISAIHALTQTLRKPDDDPGYDNDLLRAFDRLRKVNPTSSIPLPAGFTRPVSDVKTNRAAVQLTQLPASADYNTDPEHQNEQIAGTQKETRQHEKENKRLLKQSERSEKMKEKRELKLQKQLKKQQEEANKGLRKRENEEAQMKKELALKKQVSIMERFLKKSKTDIASPDSSPLTKEPGLNSPVSLNEQSVDAATQIMDKTLSSESEISIVDLRRSHLSSWRLVGQSIRSNNKFHWSIRRKPKAELYTQLKLTTIKDFSKDYEPTVENIDNVLVNISSSEDNCEHDATILRNKKRQLFQFDKSCRPAFYGIWPKKSCVVRPRHPFRKDPGLDYEFDSDEEWEEEDPGESLSDCEKDDEEDTLDQGCMKEDDDESEDGFFVPDGYLSENEGVQVDRMDTDATGAEAKDPQSEEFFALLKLQKHLNSITAAALRKNQPFVVLNLMHEKLPLLASDGLSGTPNLEKSCLQTLCMRPLPGHPLIAIDGTYDDTSSHDKAEIQSIQASAIASDASPKPQSRRQKSPPSKSKNNRQITDFMSNNSQANEETVTGSPPLLTGSRHVSGFFFKRCLPPALR